jgi:NitT/TauT family transport system permease protein
VFIGAVFPIMLNTYTCFRGVDKIYIDAAKVLGCKKGTDLIKSVLLPYSLPYIAAGIRIGLGGRLDVCSSGRDVWSEQRRFRV